MANATKDMSFAVNLSPFSSLTGSLGDTEHIWFNIYSANSTITEQATFQGKILFTGDSQLLYGDTFPSNPTVGQVFFKFV